MNSKQVKKEINEDSRNPSEDSTRKKRKVSPQEKNQITDTKQIPERSSTQNLKIKQEPIGLSYHRPDSPEVIFLGSVNNSSMVRQPIPFIKNDDGRRSGVKKESFYTATNLVNNSPVPHIHDRYQINISDTLSGSKNSPYASKKATGQIDPIDFRIKKEPTPLTCKASSSNVDNSLETKPNNGHLLAKQSFPFTLPAPRKHEWYRNNVSPRVSETKHLPSTSKTATGQINLFQSATDFINNSPEPRRRDWYQTNILATLSASENLPSTSKKATGQIAPLHNSTPAPREHGLYWSNVFESNNLPSASQNASGQINPIVFYIKEEPIDEETYPANNNKERK